MTKISSPSYGYKSRTTCKLSQIALFLGILDSSSVIKSPIEGKGVPEIIAIMKFLMEFML